MQTLISVNPTVGFTKEGEGVPPCFEFNLNVELKEQAGIDPFPDCLPEQASMKPAWSKQLVDPLSLFLPPVTLFTTCHVCACSLLCCWVPWST